MRITGGEWASRRVRGPGRGNAVRPTPDALREQAFAILVPRLAGATFLDLFAGTGIVTLEALSRGASRSIAVEASQRVAALLRSNLALLEGAPERCQVIVRPALAAVEALAAAGVRCPLAWCDPPFSHWQDGVAALLLARERGVLKADATVVLEVPTPRTTVPAGFELVRRLKGAFVLACA